MAKTDLLMNEDFHDYLRMVVVEAKVLSRQLVDANVSPEYFRGAMDMMKQVLRVPVKMAGHEGEKELAGVLVKRAFDDFEAKLLRSYLVEDKE